MNSSLLWRLSRHWNRFAYCLVDLGRALIWDKTGCNTDILRDDVFYSESTRAIMTDKD